MHVPIWECILHTDQCWVTWHDSIILLVTTHKFILTSNNSVVGRGDIRAGPLLYETLIVWLWWFRYRWRRRCGVCFPRGRRRSSQWAICQGHDTGQVWGDLLHSAGSHHHQGAVSPAGVCSPVRVPCPTHFRTWKGNGRHSHEGSFRNFVVPFRQEPSLSKGPLNSFRPPSGVNSREG